MSGEYDKYEKYRLRFKKLNQQFQSRLQNKSGPKDEMHYKECLNKFLEDVQKLDREGKPPL